MPTAHIDHQVSLDEAETALARELGPAYQVRRSSHGLTVKRGGPPLGKRPRDSG